MIHEINCPQCGGHVASKTDEQMQQMIDFASSGGSFFPLGYHDNCSARFNQYDKVKAVYNPKNIDTLKDEAKPFIDKPLMFQALWIINTGECEGQWAFQPLTMDGERVSMGWVPQEDIEVYHKFEKRGNYE